jgi:hypothetical protein
MHRLCASAGVSLDTDAAGEARRSFFRGVNGLDRGMRRGITETAIPQTYPRQMAEDRLGPRRCPQT